MAVIQRREQRWAEEQESGGETGLMALHKRIADRLKRRHP